MVATLTPAKNGTASSQKLGPCRISPHDPRLFVDPDYQRDLEPATQKKIVRSGWSEAKAGFILLNLRPNGTLAVIDGSNRIGGAKSLDVKSINAQVVQVPVEEESALYVSVNRDRKANTAIQLWKAMGNFDATVIEMNKSLAKLGFRVQLGAERVNYLSCPYALHWIFQRGGITLVESVLDFINQAWPHTKEARSSTMLQGLAHFFSIWQGQFDPARLLSVLKKCSPTEILSAAKDRRANIRHWTPYYAVSFVLADNYNRRLSSKNHLDLARYHGLQQEGDA